jgi:UDP-N-acetylglucosamine/UDP-N-acetylgalactosamine diphosphorylase
MLPAVDDRGKLVLETRSRVFLSPNGHGGVFDAFRRSGALEDATRRGLEHLFYFQVDNVLIRIADPVFMGFHALRGSDYSLKLLRKTGPYEKLGVVVMENGGRHRLIEYSDLTKEEAERRGADGELVYWAGSPAIHAFSLAFFRKIAEGSIALPYHVARKSIPTVDDSGRPTEVQGRKFESFVFDALPYAGRVLNLEVRREEEFAPVKNRTGEDSLESAHALLVEEHRRWLREAGATVAGRAEVSPRVALCAEDLQMRLPEEARRAYPGDVIVERGPQGTVEVRAIR